MKGDRSLQIIGISFLGLIVLWLVNTIFFPSGNGMSVRYNMPSYYSDVYTNYNGINGLIISIIQVLLVVFIVAFVVGVVMIVKNNLLMTEDKDSINQQFTYNPDHIKNELVNEKINCVECGCELELEWEICPNCGESK